jgi:hypothetical protein
MTVGIITALFVIAAVAYVVYPIGRRPATFVEAEDATDAEVRKQVALSGILDLEEERDGGKLSETEFRSLRAHYEHDAVAAMTELDGTPTPTSLEERLESEIADARRKLVCATCGVPRAPGGTRCPSCGSPY